MKKHIYMCIDLKTFYASCECSVRNLDPFETNLVVADDSRGKGALCLAITPKLKAMGIHNRCRLYEIPEGIDYIVAKPRMELYMKMSADIYSIYLKYIAKEDILVYSIDEVFMDVTPYRHLYHMRVQDLAHMILDDIYQETRITATVGIGTNMYLAKIAMDIIAKHVDSHMGFLTEETYKKILWHYQPLTDFWQIGRGIAKRLAKYEIYDMYGIAHFDEQILYKEFGINAKYLIDHAWGIEDMTIEEVHRYQPKNRSINHSQVLFEDYSYVDALLVVKEMVELKVLDLVGLHLVTDRVSLSIGYSGNVIRPTGGSRKLPTKTNSYTMLLDAFTKIYEQTTNPGYLIRQVAISFGDVVDEIYETFDLFSDIEALHEERQLNLAIGELRHKYGKNAILKGMNLLDKATTIKRNGLVGGHNAK